MTPTLPKGINLRGDLAKLSNAELAARLDALWMDYEAAERHCSPSWLHHSARGPIRHPRVYRFLGLLGGGGGGSWLDVLLAALLSGKRFKSLGLSDRANDMHLALCEIRDVNDEIERRMRDRSGAAA